MVRVIEVTSEIMLEKDCDLFETFCLAASWIAHSGRSWLPQRGHCERVGADPGKAPGDDGNSAEALVAGGLETHPSCSQTPDPQDW